MPYTFGIVVVLTGDPCLLLVEMGVATPRRPRKECMGEDLTFAVKRKVVSMISPEKKTKLKFLRLITLQ